MHNDKLIPLAQAAGLQVTLTAADGLVARGGLADVSALLFGRRGDETSHCEMMRALRAARNVGASEEGQALRWPDYRIFAREDALRSLARARGLWRVQLCREDGSTPLGEGVVAWVRFLDPARVRPEHGPATATWLACRAHPGYESYSWAYVPDLLGSECFASLGPVLPLPPEDQVIVG